MSAKLLLAFILLAPAVLPAQGSETTQYYASNRLGMELQEIGWYRVEEFPYVLVVEREEGLEIRTLMHEGEELQRWEYTEEEQRVYKGSELEERRRYDEKGRLVEEQLFSEGRLERRIVYTYNGDVLERTETFSEAGALLFRDLYRLSPDGRLRRVTRQPGEEPADQRLALGEGSRGVTEERYGDGRERRVNRYDQTGRLVEREYWSDGELIERERFQYRDEGEALISSRLEEFPLQRVTLRSHDEEGRVVEIQVTEGGKQTERTFHLRDSRGRITETTRRGHLGMENWRFEYGPDGTLVKEEYRVRGSLQRISRYSEQEGEPSRVDELFREGELFMRVYYLSEQKVREEFIESGEAVRVREFP
jgi:hypothetical protein